MTTIPLARCAALASPLDGAPPGRYEATVVVTDVLAGHSAEVREPFDIEGAVRRESRGSASREVGSVSSS